MYNFSHLVHPPHLLQLPGLAGRLLLQARVLLLDVQPLGLLRLQPLPQGLLARDGLLELAGRLIKQLLLLNGLACELDTI